MTYKRKLYFGEVASDDRRPWASVISSILGTYAGMDHYDSHDDIMDMEESEVAELHRDCLALINQSDHIDRLSAARAKTVNLIKIQLDV